MLTKKTVRSKIILWSTHTVLSVRLKTWSMLPQTKVYVMSTLKICTPQTHWWVLNVDVASDQSTSLELVLATPTQIGAAETPDAAVPSQCRLMDIGYDPCGQDRQASAKSLPCWTPVPYKGDPWESVRRTDFQCNSQGFCLRTSINQANVDLWTWTSMTIAALVIGNATHR